MRVLITGATGLVGTHLCAYLQQQGHEVLRMLRREQPKKVGIKDLFWDPRAGVLPVEGLQGVDVVVHLAGASIAGAPWTRARKQLLWDSRVGSTQLWVRTLGAWEKRALPKVFICASAVGYYAYREGAVDETSPVGTGFLAHLCQQWEAAAAAAAAFGLRVLCLRIGLVLSAKGGALRPMWRAQRLGLGAVLGSGKQYISWIHLQDLLRMIGTAIQDDRWRGVYNATAPHPESQACFARALAQACGRKLWLPPVPGILLRAALGPMSELLLKGQYVLPARAQRAGFHFTFPELPAALKDLLRGPGT